MAEDMFKRFRKGADGGANPRAEFNRIREAELLAAVDRLPALPEIAMRVLQTSDDEHSSAADLQTLIQQDMVISGRLLKLVNSSFYSLPNQVTSITQAVAIVGMRSLRSLVVAVSTTEIMDTDISGYRFADKGLWRNSMVTAGLAQNLARLAGVAPKACDRFFAAGLLRNVGMLVIGPFLDKLGIRLNRDEVGEDLIAKEREVVKFDHCWAGERVAEKWSLPDELRFVIGQHHLAPSDLPPERRQLLQTVTLAERIAFRAGVGVEDDHPFPTAVDGELVMSAGLDTEGLKTALALLPGIVEATELDGRA